MKLQSRNVVTELLILISIFFFTACSSGTDDSNPSQSKTIDPANAEAGEIQFKIVGRTIELDASQSTGTGLNYHWTFRNVPNGSTARLSDFEAANPTFTVDKPGSYVAQLIIMDSAKGTSKDFTVVNIAGSTADAQNANLQSHIGFSQSCQTCHNGVDATGRPANHIEATKECIVCHSVVAWSPNIAIDHNEILGTCSTCHNDVRVLGKPANHIETTAECNQCHNAGTTFTLAILPLLDDGIDDHPPIGDMMCIDCHNNVIEEGKPADHIPASDACENCHTTMDWTIPLADGSTPPPDMDDDEEEEMHPPIGDAMCVDCHNNVIEEGKEDDHILTTDLCEACHVTSDWEDIMTVDHTQVIGECSSCHDNDIAMGKPAGHIETAEECNVCHSTTAWTPTIASGGGGTVGTVDHSTFTAATVCMNCHNGTIATGKPIGHPITNSDCDVCHTTTSWL